MPDELLKLGEIAILALTLYYAVQALRRFGELISEGQKATQKTAETATTALNESNVQTELMRQALDGIRRDTNLSRVALGQLAEIGSENLRIAQVTSEDTKKLPETLMLEVIKALAPILTQMTTLTNQIEASNEQGGQSRVLLEALSRSLREARIEFVGAVDSVIQEPIVPSVSSITTGEMKAVTLPTSDQPDAE